MIAEQEKPSPDLGPPAHLPAEYQAPLMSGEQHPKVFRCGREFQAFDRWTKRDPETFTQVEALCVCGPCYTHWLEESVKKL